MSEEFDPKYTTEATSENTSQPTGETIINNDRRGGLVNWLRKDSIGMGILIGFIVPAATFGVIYGAVALVLSLTGKQPTEIIDIDMVQKFILLSLIPSVFTMRHYLLKLKYDRTGRGILLVTFLVAILFAILEFGVK